MPYYPKFDKPKIIPYPSAPSGKIEVTKYVEPFMPVKKGFGFLGILAEDTKTGQLQCHVCGKWYEQLNSHIIPAHKMTPDDYRIQFGLSISTALKSKRVRLIQSAVITKLQKEGKMNIGNNFNKSTGKSYGFKKKNKYAGNRKGKHKAIETKNKAGVCDLQIKIAIVELSKLLNKTPTLCDLKEFYGQKFVSVMYSRYTSYLKYCKKELKAYGLLPNFSTHNPKFKTKKAYKNYLIQQGLESMKRGNSPKNIKTLLNIGDAKKAYLLFGGYPQYRKELLKKI